jgi:hypothetical protein
MVVVRQLPRRAPRIFPTAHSKHRTDVLMVKVAAPNSLIVLLLLLVNPIKSNVPMARARLLLISVPLPKSVPRQIFDVEEVNAFLTGPSVPLMPLAPLGMQNVVMDPVMESVQQLIKHVRLTKSLVPRRQQEHSVRLI